MKTFVSGRPYWWQWITILSLDATAVSLAWQGLFARLANVELRPEHRWILGSSVWCAYAADRWIEGWRLPAERALTQRHYFSVRWRWPLFAVWCVVFALDLTVALTRLSSREFSAGLLLLGPVLLYLFSHQLFHRNSPWRLPKEICVAALLSGGVLVFVLAQPGVEFHAVASAALGFALLCFANCALISVWEREVDAQHGQDSLAQRSHRAADAARLLPWFIALSSAAFGAAHPEPGSKLVFGCLAVSAALLGGVDVVEPRIGRQLARVLSDIVLLTPFIALALT